MIFQIDEETVKQNVAITKDELKWINIGVEFRKARAKGVTAKAFSEEKGINYGTFTKSMFRYKAKIDFAIEAEKAGAKPQSKLTRREREVMMINSFRQSLRKNIATSKIAGAKDKSQKWFNETIKQGVRGHKVSRPTPGKLYAYHYDAKHKDTLPYWDRYPLIIFLGFATSTKSGTLLMHGLNLHYVPPKARQEFLESLLKQYASTPVLSNSTKLKIDWSKVKGFKGADQMIKAYLPSHIKGQLIEVKPADWANVVMLPLQSFQSQGKPFSANKVWSKVK